MMNVCKVNEECTDMLPSVSVLLQTGDGQKIIELKTGPMAQTTSPEWKRYSGTFYTPVTPGLVGFTMSTISSGVCGNDFALDDILICGCYPPPPLISGPKPVLVEEPKLVEQTPQPIAVARRKAAQEQAKPEPKFNKKTVNLESLPAGKKAQVISAIKKIPVPEPIKNRPNTLVRRLLFPTGKVVVELYDNGTIDGDTLSIYDNNVLMVYRAGLSENQFG